LPLNLIISFLKYISGDLSPFFFSFSFLFGKTEKRKNGKREKKEALRKINNTLYASFLGNDSQGKFNTRANN
jgi:hypothetical protein